jgi:hypothetical protein
VPKEDESCKRLFSRELGLKARKGAGKGYCSGREQVVGMFGNETGRETTGLLVLPFGGQAT